MSRIFFNAEGNYIGDINKYLDVASLSQPNWATIINSLNLVNQLRAVSPKTKIIYREKTNDFPSEDAGIWKSVHPVSYANYLMRHGNKSDWLYVLNEPPISGRASDLSNWLVQCSKTILDNGFAGAVLGNFAVGNLGLNDIKNGQYDNLIRYAAENRNRVRIGLHEGSGVLLPVGVGLIDFNVILRGDHISEFPNVPKAWLNKYTEQFYHILRYQWLQARADEIQLSQKPLYVMTEFCIDNLSDLLEPLIAPLEKKYGISQLRGYKTYAPVWHDLLGLSLSHAYVKQLLWADNQYPNDVDGIMIYCWWNNFKQWESFDVSDDLIVQEWLKYHKSPVGGQPPVITNPEFPPLDKWENVFIAPRTTKTNVRKEPSVNSSIVFILEGKKEIKMYQAGKVDKFDGTWIPVNELGIYGWVRQDVVRLYKTENLTVVYNPENVKDVELLRIAKQIIGTFE